MDRIDRFIAIHRVLQRKRPVPFDALKRNIEEIVRGEVSVATVKRDLQYMRLHLGAPIEFCKQEPKGYRYVPDADRFELPGFWLNADELQALLVSAEALRQMEPGILSETVGPLRERIAELLRHTGFKPENVTGAVEARMTFARRLDAATFRAVTGALLRGRALQFDYHARSTDRTTSRLVDPLRLTFYKNNWYLLAGDRERGEWRLFALDRIRDVVELQIKAKRVSAAKIAKRLAVGFGIFLTDDTRWATLRFSAEHARWVADELWHPEQKGARLPDGRYELRLPYGDVTELTMEVLRHGADVEVVAPLELRRAVREQLAAALKVYA